MDTKTFFDMSYGLFVLSVVTPEGKPTGCTVNTAFQITSTPPTLALSVNHQNYTNELIRKTGRVCVNILSQNVDIGIIGGFGFRSGRDNDKFANVPYVMEQGLPVLTEGVCGHFICKVVGETETSTHTIFLVEVEDAVRTGEGKVPPMTYAYYHQVKNGTEPPTAPTFVAKEEAPAAEKYVCPVCGYIYDGSGGPFEDLPGDWKCPLCKVPKARFEKR